MGTSSVVGLGTTDNAMVRDKLKRLCQNINDSSPIPSSLNDFFPFEYLTEFDAFKLCIHIQSFGENAKIDSLRTEIDTRLTNFETQVQRLIETCNTRGIDLRVIHHLSVDSGLLELEEVVVRGKEILNPDQKEAICKLAIRRKTDWTDSDKNLYSEWVAEINYHRKKRQSTYEKICAENGGLVPLGDRSWGNIPENLLIKFNKVANMKLSHEELSNVCKILEKYLSMTADKTTETSADTDAFNNLDSIEARHKSGFKETFHKIYKGLKGIKVLG